MVDTMPLEPDVVMATDAGVWSFYSAKKVGIAAVTYFQHNTGATLATMHGNPNERVASRIAWANARHSRAPGNTIDILLEMCEKGIDADKKAADMFRNYGHASVADLARLTIQFNDVPMHVPLYIFNDEDVDEGQEKSTRFQKKFSGAVMHKLDYYIKNPPEHLSRLFETLGILALKNFAYEQKIVTNAFTNYFKPTTDKERASLDSRVLDTVRFNLLLGQYTGFANQTTARDWARTISRLKASELKYYNDLGAQIELILAPDPEIEKRLGFKAEAPSMIANTEADFTLKNNLKALSEYITQKGLAKQLFGTIIKQPIATFIEQDVDLISDEYSVSEKMITQYMLTIHPGADYKRVLSSVRDLPTSYKLEISAIVFNGHTHQKELSTQLSTTEEISMVLRGTLGELRDFNRHRASGRFLQHIPLFNGPKFTKGQFEEVLSQGYGLPLYVTEIPEFELLKSVMNVKFFSYYAALMQLQAAAEKEYGNDIDYTFMMNLLPLAQKSNIWMHSNIKQADYLGNLRIRPGGHINYRQLVYDATEKLSQADPFLRSIMPDAPRPNPSGRDEFFNRS